MLYDDPNCSNSTHWEKLRSIQIVLVLAGLVLFISTLVVCGIYLSKRKKNKKKAKKFLKACLITFVCSITFLICGRVMGEYVHSKTKDLGYCWSSK